MHKPNPHKIDVTCRLMGKAQKLLAYGGLDGVVQRPLHDGAGGVFPHFATAAQGCRFTDSTGQEFIDLVNGWGPVLLGYRHPKVEAAITDQLKAGPTLSLMNPVEVQVAELITRMVPCAEMVAFAKNGSDSVLGAIRVARAVTGRDLILQYGFHGFHDWYACVHPTVKGIPQVAREQVASFEYNDVEGLQELFAQHRDRVAAVIMEPVNMWMPEKGYLQAVRELTHANGALLIFDEIVTSFRIARGGAQERFGVQPDLACLGKGMGNGMPLSAIVGRRDYMQMLKRCGIGLTFRGETLSLAAAKATLEVIRDEPVTDHIRNIGEQIRIGFANICRELGIKAHLSGPACRMTFVFHEQAGVGWEEARALFLQDCLRHGVMTNGNILVSYATDEAAVKEILTAFRKSLTTVAAAYSANDPQSALATGGSMFGIKAVSATGFLDQIRDVGNNVLVTGWILLDSGAADGIELQTSTGKKFAAEIVERPGLKMAFPKHERAEKAGFRAEIPRAMLENGEQYKFSIIALGDGKPKYECQIEYQTGEPFQGPYSIDTGVIYV